MKAFCFLLWSNQRTQVKSKPIGSNLNARASGERDTGQPVLSLSGDRPVRLVCQTFGRSSDVFQVLFAPKKINSELFQKTFHAWKECFCKVKFSPIVFASRTVAISQQWNRSIHQGNVECYWGSMRKNCASECLNYQFRNWNWNYFAYDFILTLLIK